MAVDVSLQTSTAPKTEIEKQGRDTGVNSGLAGAQNEQKTQSEGGIVTTGDAAVDAIQQTHPDGISLSLYGGVQKDEFGNAGYENNTNNAEFTTQAKGGAKAYNSVDSILNMGNAMLANNVSAVKTLIKRTYDTLMSRYTAAKPATAPDAPSHLKIKNLSLYYHGGKQNLYMPGTGLNTSNLNDFISETKYALKDDVSVQLYACNAANGDDSLAAQMAMGLGNQALVYGHTTAAHTTENSDAKVYNSEGQGTWMFDVLMPESWLRSECSRVWGDNYSEAAYNKLKERARVYYNKICGTGGDWYSSYRKDFEAAVEEHPVGIGVYANLSLMGREMFADPENAANMLQAGWRHWALNHERSTLSNQGELSGSFEDINVTSSAAGTDIGNIQSHSENENTQTNVEEPAKTPQPDPGNANTNNNQSSQGVDLAHGSLADTLTGGESNHANARNGAVCNPYDVFNHYSPKLHSSYFGLIDGKAISEHTFGEIIALQRDGSTLNISYRDGDGPETRTGKLFAVGKFQMIPDTLKGAKTSLGFKDSDVFSPSAQDRCFSEYLITSKKGRGAIISYINGESDDIDAAARAAAYEWASVGVKPGANTVAGTPGTADGLTTYYNKSGDDKASISYFKICEALNADRAAVASGGIAQSGLASNKDNINVAPADPQKHPTQTPETKPETSVTESTTTETPSAPATVTEETYTVKSGDTLSSIASKFHVAGGYKALADYNNISNPNVIHVGQVLKIPGTAKPVEQTEAPAATQTENQQTAPATEKTPEVKTAGDQNKNSDPKSELPEDVINQAKSYISDVAAVIAWNANKKYNEDTWNAIQAKLNVSQTGAPNEITVYAITAFQIQKKIDIDGKCGPQTLKKLGVTASTEPSKPKSGETQGSAKDVDDTALNEAKAHISNVDSVIAWNVNKNYSSDTWNAIQAKLNVPQTGAPNEVTIYAITAFQIQQKIDIDGKCGKDTLKKLGITATTATENTQTTPAPTQTVKEPDPAAELDQSIIDEAKSYISDVAAVVAWNVNKMYSKETWNAIQAKLNVSQTGSPNEATIYAITAFQIQQKIDIDGKCGSGTLGKLGISPTYNLSDIDNNGTIKEKQKALFGRELTKTKSGDPESWVKGFLSSVTVKARGLNSSNSKTLTVHKALVGHFQNMFQEVYEQTTFKFNSLGTYNYRTIKNPNKPNSQSLSYHSYGVALDINPSNNPFDESKKVANQSNSDTVIRSTDHPVVKILGKYGFGWGGRYCDYMHFSYFNGS